MIQLTDHGPDPPFQLTGRLFSAMIGSGKQKAIFSWIPLSVLSAAKGRRVQINKALRHNVRKGCLFMNEKTKNLILLIAAFLLGGCNQRSRV